MKELTINHLKIRIFENRSLMGTAAAMELSRRVHVLLDSKEYVNIIFAAAPSQNEFLSALSDLETDWSRINAFHMDEYIGLDNDAPQGFGNFLRERLFAIHPFREIHYLNGQATDLQQECSRYAGLLVKYPADMVCLGIGENTHLAFNDPQVADFNDPEIVKVVELDETCRW
ncbi:MAG TPA: glucosamine-6-phosphate deaminase, partial [Chitinophagaceae bacterium]|nr:glucosamine-6-phosphate deaminase [Chitinophagaceae bacterium]